MALVSGTRCCQDDIKRLMSPPCLALDFENTQDYKRLQKAQALLDHASEQLLLLDRREGELLMRYRRAKSSSRASFVGSLRLQLDIIHAVKDHYYRTADRLADDLERELDLQETSS